MLTDRPVSQDNIALYQSAIDALEDNPDETSLDALNLKHRAVLALARSGATDFAESEYKRYGLQAVKAHEDIMALAGRLAKDRYEASGDINMARESANFYEAAFQNTGGYYSGINAATMSLIAKVPSEIVMGRAQAVLARLSALTGESREDRYYMEASRAEAHYILGDRASAQAALQAALDYDPLNYTAHASTGRQFRLLAKAHGETMEWLTPLRAPLSVHFAGHLFSTIKDEDRLCVAMSDLIQKEDIGFGYGALAAGSDIIFAESLLAEGGELHVVLPVPVELFKKRSVQALEQKNTNWTSRFETCLDKASSVRCVSDRDVWPDPLLNNFAARVAMGQACAQSHRLNSDAGQVLIWDKKSVSLTAQHAKDWAATAGKLQDGENDARPQFVLEFPEARPAKSKSCLKHTHGLKVKTALAKNGQIIASYDTVAAALNAAEDALSVSGHDSGYGLHIAPATTDADVSLSEVLSRQALPGSLFVSQDMAAIISLEHSADWETGFTGHCKADGQSYPTWFAKKIRAEEN